MAVQKPKRASRLSKFIRVFFWNVFLVGVGIVLLEAVFGNWLHSDPMRLLNVQREKTWHYRAIAAEIKEQDRDIIYHRDKWGLRGNYGEPAEIDILSVGGSTTDQKYVTEGKTWQDVMQARFHSAGMDVRVANAGVDGRTTFGHMKDFELWFPNVEGLRPRYVLLYVGINDMYYDQPGDRDNIIRHTFPLIDVKQWIRDNSAFYFVYRSLIGMYQAHAKDLVRKSVDFRDVDWVEQPVRTDHAVILKPRLDAYRRRLTRLGVRIIGWGARPVFVTQPRGDYLLRGDRVLGLARTQSRVTRVWRDALLGELNEQTANGVDYYLILKLFNTVTMEVCRELEGICIDLFNDLHFSIGDFYDHAHTTVAGSSKIGEFLFEGLKIDINENE